MMILRAASSAAVALALAAAPTAVHAAEDPLQVSVDGVTFTSSNDLPLLTAIGRYVPGDTTTDSVWVKNTTSHAGRLRIEIVDPVSDSPDFAAALSLGVTSPDSPTGSEVTLHDALANGSCTVLRNDQVIKAGETIRIDATAHVSPLLSERDGVLSNSSFVLRGVLTDAAAASDANVGDRCSKLPDVPVPAPKDPLAFTGSPGNTATLIAFGLLASLGGFFAIWRSRRKQRDKATTI